MRIKDSTLFFANGDIITLREIIQIMRNNSWKQLATLLLSKLVDNSKNGEEKLDFRFESSSFLKYKYFFICDKVS